MGEVIEIDANKTKALAAVEEISELLRQNKLASFVIVAIESGDRDIVLHRHYLATNPLSLVSLVGATECVQDELKIYARQEMEA